MATKVNIIKPNLLDMLGPDELGHITNFLKQRLHFAITNTEHLFTVNPEIEKLTVHGLLKNADGRVFWLKDKILEQIVNRFKSLTELNLSSCYKISDEGVIAVAKKLTNLTKLNLEWCTKITNDSVDALAGCTNLTDLNLSMCDKITNVVPVLQSCTELKHLNLNCLDITDEQLMKLTSTNLEDLRLQCCADITNQSLNFLKNRCPNLNTLDIYFCSSFDCNRTDIFPNELTYLNISGTNITQDGIRQLATKCTNLSQLELQDSTSITDVLPFLDFKNLSYLNLNGCIITNLTQPEEQHSKLNFLSIRNSNVNMVNVQAFLDKCPNLTMLQLNYNFVFPTGDIDDFQKFLNSRSTITTVIMHDKIIKGGGAGGVEGGADSIGGESKYQHMQLRF